MKKSWIAVVGVGLLAAVFAADYTVPKSWTRNGAEYVKVSRTVYNPLITNTPVEIRVNLNLIADVPGSEKLVIWTPEKVLLLPEVIEGVTNVFRTRMINAFGRSDIVNAYNWGLVAGREAFLIPGEPE